jgi:hypothetical protein
MRYLIAQKPVHKVRLDYGSTNVGIGAWVAVVASMPVPACGVELFNASGSTLKISTGAIGLEDASELPYYVLPGGSSILLPLEFSSGQRLSVRAVDVVANVGSLVMNFFG